jgi:hypothetical protein
MARRKQAAALIPGGAVAYGGLGTGIADLLDQARRGAARAIKSILTATYWEIGRRIVEFEQGGAKKAEYGEALLVRLAADLIAKFGRGVFQIKPVSDARLLPELGNIPDAVWKIGGPRAAVGGDIPDTVWNIFRSAKSGDSAWAIRTPDSRERVPALLVSLRPLDVDEELAGPPLLRIRSSPRRLVGAATRPANQRAVL